MAQATGLYERATWPMAPLCLRPLSNVPRVGRPVADPFISSLTCRFSQDMQWCPAANPPNQPLSWNGERKTGTPKMTKTVPETYQFRTSFCRKTPKTVKNDNLPTASKPSALCFPILDRLPCGQTNQLNKRF